MVYAYEINIREATDRAQVKYKTRITVKNESSSDEIYEQRVTLNPSNFRQAHEPTIQAIYEFLNNVLNTRKRRSRYSYDIDKPREFNYVVTIGSSSFSGEGLPILFYKKGTRYGINGKVTSKENLLRSLARTIYRSCFTNDSIELYNYLERNLILPENVSYALENRAPFHWYKEREKVDCRFRVEMVGENQLAIEISDGIWAPISIKDLDVYMNFYWKEKKGGSWKHLSPKKLWVKLMGKKPTETQQKLMVAFLEQNRTQHIVEERAKELMEAMQRSNPNRIRIIEKAERTYMIVRGKLADWVLSDAEYKSDIQMVSTFIVKHNEGGHGLKPKLALHGPICIDNMTRHSSVGDQFCARALALLNDEMTVAMVNTIKRYIEKYHVSGQNECRLDWNNLEGFINARTVS